MQFKHVASGGVYTLRAIALTEADLTPVALYVASDGTIWVRPAAEFFDGRFQVHLPDPA